MNVIAPWSVLDGADRLRLNERGEVVDEFGRVVGAGKVQARPASGYDNPGATLPPAQQYYDNPGAMLPQLQTALPPARQYLDQSRARSAPPGYSTLEEALADRGGFALQGSDGRWYRSNQDRDRARAASDNLQDQYEAFRALAPKLGVPLGPNREIPLEAFSAHLKNVGMTKQAQALLEEQTAKQFQLTEAADRAQFGAERLKQMEMDGMLERERLQADSRRELAGLSSRSQMQQSFAGKAAELLAQGDKQGYQVFMEAAGMGQRLYDQNRRGGDPRLVPPDDETARQNTLERVDRYRQAKELAQLFGLQPLEINGKPDLDEMGQKQYAKFDADKAIAAAAKTPGILQDEMFRHYLQQAGTKKDAMIDALERAMIRRANSLSANYYKTHDPATTQPAKGFALSNSSTFGKRRYDLQRPDGSVMTYSVPSLPLMSQGAGLVDLIYNLKGSTDERYRKEAELAGLLLNELYTIR